MATIILGICDPHWTDRKPVSRLDDFPQTQKTKTLKILGLAQSLEWKTLLKLLKIEKPPEDDLPERQPADAICIAGDLFHIPKGEAISRQLDVWLLDHLNKAGCPIFGICGNHDLENLRLDSVSKHPIGVLHSARTIRLMDWPDYCVVGDNPQVLVSGRHFALNEPQTLLEELRKTQILYQIKEQYQIPFFYLMTHNFWGHSDGKEHSSLVLAHQRLCNTGVDVCLYGHPHRDEGIQAVLNRDGRTSEILGPGSMVRGTIAEHDTERIPKISLSVFWRTGEKHHVFLEVPHRPASEVFHLKKHERLVKRKASEEKLLTELKAMEFSRKTPFEALSEGDFPERVMMRTRTYLQRAEKGD